MLKSIEPNNSYDCVAGIKVVKAICVVVKRMCTPEMIYAEEEDGDNSNSSRTQKVIKFRTI